MAVKANAGEYVVVDGDTIKNSDSGYIRILGIDTPEIKGQCKSEKDKAVQAKKYLESILESSKEVKVVGNKTDKYGRLLALVYADGVSVSSLMLQANLARVYDGGKRESWCG
jgi:endonuclease YncB( thermonuclease family)